MVADFQLSYHGVFFYAIDMIHFFLKRIEHDQILVSYQTLLDRNILVFPDRNIFSLPDKNVFFLSDKNIIFLPD